MTSTLPAQKWNGAVKALHWGLALILLFEVPAGFLMSYTYGPSFRDGQILKLHILASQIHHTVGFFVLCAGSLWLALKLWTRRPPLPSAMPGHERVLALGAHGCLLALLLLVPWSGWTALSALADSKAFGVTHIWFFGTDQWLPRIWRPMAPTDPQGYGLFAQMHRWLLIVGACIAGIHLASALWHHVVRRDLILRRMWPLSS